MTVPVAIMDMGVLIPGLLASSLVIGLVCLRRARSAPRQLCHFCPPLTVADAADRVFDEPPFLQSNLFCANCGQYSGFDAHGDYDMPVPGMAVTDDEGDVSNGDASSAAADNPTSLGLLCEACHRQQGAKMAFFASVDPSSITDERWPQYYDTLRSQADVMYPLCTACAQATAHLQRPVGRELTIPLQLPPPQLGSSMQFITSFHGRFLALHAKYVGAILVHLVVLTMFYTVCTRFLDCQDSQDAIGSHSHGADLQWGVSQVTLVLTAVHQGMQWILFFPLQGVRQAVVWFSLWDDATVISWWNGLSDTGWEMATLVALTTPHWLNTITTMKGTQQRPGPCVIVPFIVSFMHLSSIRARLNVSSRLAFSCFVSHFCWHTDIDHTHS